MRRKLLVALATPVAVLAFSVPTVLADDDDDGASGGAQTVVFGSDGSETFSLAVSPDGTCATDSAVVVPKHPAWADPIPNTQWISVDANSGAPTPPPFICYQRLFDLPEDCETATLSVRLHVDNDASVMPPGTPPGGIYLNGVLFGSTPPGPLVSNFQDPPEGPYATTGPFNEQGNALQIRAHDYHVVTGLDYEATLTCADDGEDDDGDDDDGDDDDGGDGDDGGDDNGDDRGIL